MLDATNGEALMGKTPTTARKLISTMTTNTQQFGVRDAMTRPVDDSKNDALEKIASMMETFFKGKTLKVKPCKLCSTTEHTTDDCRILNDEIEQHANAISFGIFQGRWYDPHSNTYYPGLRYHPNLRYRNQQNQPIWRKSESPVHRTKFPIV
ncbi:hypothetical protein ACS0TY_027035 [Phlomoides rotata]